MKKNILYFIISILLLMPALADTAPAKINPDNKFKSKYFVFHYTDDVENIPEFAKFSDGFIDFFKKEFYDPKMFVPMNIYVLKDRDAFIKFMKERFQRDVPDRILGQYLYIINGFITYEKSGIGTFAHEIMHILVYSNYKKPPNWMHEGVPMFFDMIYGYWDNDKLILDYGYVNIWKIYTFDNNILFRTPPINTLLDKQMQTGKQNLIPFFLHKHNKLKEYLNLMRYERKNGYSTFLEAAFKKNYSEIQPLWKDFIEEVRDCTKQINWVPESQILKSKEEFDNFMKENRMKDKRGYKKLN